MRLCGYEWTYGEDSISTLLAHYGIDRPAETLQGEEIVKEATISPEILQSGKPPSVYG